MAQKFYTNIEILADVTEPKHAATKEYVDGETGRVVEQEMDKYLKFFEIGEFGESSQTLK